jgi:3-carboxy-cis,cis-muconate cycloisomerase
MKPFFSISDSLATTEPLAVVFGDASILGAMLSFESALARVQADLGIIPRAAADAIQKVASVHDLDIAAIARDARESGTFVVPFVKALTARVRASDPESASFVHWGATSQDVSDTALVLTLKGARSILLVDHEPLDGALRTLSERHARTIMLARTLLQPAGPTTFGLKVAEWVAALARGWARVETRFDDALVLQFGGASGTLAALGDRGPAVAAALARELGLRNPDAPWHAYRDRLAALMAALGIYTGTLGKIARDVSLLMQDEVGEVSEPGGGSSSMPHKRNPAGCAIALAASVRLPSLVSAFLTGMVQEHERAVGGWHAEWPTIAAAVQTTGSALEAIADVVDGFEVFPDRMRENLERTKGTIFAERAMVLLSPRAGKDVAHQIVSEALTQVRATGRTFREALSAVKGVDQWITADQLSTIDRPEEYLGAAETLRQSLLTLPAERPSR